MMINLRDVALGCAGLDPGPLGSVDLLVWIFCLSRAPLSDLFDCLGTTQRNSHDALIMAVATTDAVDGCQYYGPKMWKSLGALVMAGALLTHTELGTVAMYVCTR